ncbi:hypothetical protein HaLaN_10535 [Haematococcus lacustris]|uniref:Uncharacterized protein n=1 Tax=Haematococcus lacustris TaxID=44745 RepID=A0A699Z6E3_HAELA|nr:hypothetical protein HaLaN_10535 [Haematococcus lacustris]
MHRMSARTGQLKVCVCAYGITIPAVLAVMAHATLFWHGSTLRLPAAAGVARRSLVPRPGQAALLMCSCWRSLLASHGCVSQGGRGSGSGWMGNSGPVLVAVTTPGRLSDCLALCPRSGKAGERDQARPPAVATYPLHTPNPLPPTAHACCTSATSVGDWACLLGPCSPPPYPALLTLEGGGLGRDGRGDPCSTSDHSLESLAHHEQRRQAGAQHLSASGEGLRLGATGRPATLPAVEAAVDSQAQGGAGSSPGTMRQAVDCGVAASCSKAAKKTKTSCPPGSSQWCGCQLQRSNTAEPEGAMLTYGQQMAAAGPGHAAGC